MARKQLSDAGRDIFTGGLNQRRYWEGMQLLADDPAAYNNALINGGVYSDRGQERSLLPMGHTIAGFNLDGRSINPSSPNLLMRANNPIGTQPNTGMAQPFKLNQGYSNPNPFI